MERLSFWYLWLKYIIGILSLCFSQVMMISSQNGDSLLKNEGKLKVGAIVLFGYSGE